MTNRFVFAAAFLALAACGGGIDTPDEQVGPPTSAINEPQPPRPCPIDPAACHPKPFPG